MPSLKAIEIAKQELPRSTPRYIRLPRSGDRDPLTSLSRTALYALISGPNPKVRSVVVNGRPSSRGIRLIVTESLLQYLEELSTTTTNASEGSTN